jgi:hypothetical protein
MGNNSIHIGKGFTPSPQISTEKTKEKLSLSKLDVKSAANEVLMSERKPASPLSPKAVSKNGSHKKSNFMLSALKTATKPPKI